MAFESQMDADPERCSCSALRQAARHVTRLYDGALGPVDLGLNQYAVLTKLDRFGPQILQDLADRLVMDRSSLGHLLRPLQQRGILTIEASTADRRQRVIALTAEGVDLMARAKPLWAAVERRFDVAFGSGESRNLRTILKRVTLVALDA